MCSMTKSTRRNMSRTFSTPSKCEIFTPSSSTDVFIKSQLLIESQQRIAIEVLIKVAKVTKQTERECFDCETVGYHYNSFSSTSSLICINKSIRHSANVRRARKACYITNKYVQLTVDDDDLSMCN